jgi:hypothetical protein
MPAMLDDAPPKAEAISQSAGAFQAPQGVAVFQPPSFWFGGFKPPLLDHALDAF